MRLNRLNRRAFTLLEVVVALAILGVSLVAVLDINASAVQSHVYSKKLTVATLLARSKMMDLEQKLYDDPLPADDEEDAGDFSDEGWPSYKWRAKTIAPKMNGLSPDQLIGALFNFPMGGDDGPGSMLSGLFNNGKDKPKDGPQPDGANPLAALGPMAGMAQQQFTQMVDQLQKSVREVHLTVSWKEGKITESIDLVTHVVSLGAGTNAAAAQQQALTPGGLPGGPSGLPPGLASPGAPLPP